MTYKQIKVWTWFLSFLNKYFLPSFHTQCDCSFRNWKLSSTPSIKNPRLASPKPTHETSWFLLSPIVSCRNLLTQIQRTLNPPAPFNGLLPLSMSKNFLLFQHPFRCTLYALHREWVTKRERERESLAPFNGLLLKLYLGMHVLNSSLLLYFKILPLCSQFRLLLLLIFFSFKFCVYFEILKFSMLYRHKISNLRSFLFSKLIMKLCTIFLEWLCWEDKLIWKLSNPPHHERNTKEINKFEGGQVVSLSISKPKLWYNICLFYNQFLCVKLQIFQKL